MKIEAKRPMRILLHIVAVVVNAVFYLVLRADLYTDRAVMPDGMVRQWQRSPIDRLYISDQPVLLYLQFAFAAVSVIPGVMLLFGCKNRIVRTVRLVSTIASAAMFIIIMLVTCNLHVNYA